MSTKARSLEERIITWALLPTVIVTPLLFNQHTYELFEYPKIMFVYAAAIIVGTMWILRMLSARQIVYRRSPFDLAIALFLLANLVSTLTSIDRHTSFFGYYSRFNAGFLPIVAYTLLTLAALTFATPTLARRLIIGCVVSATIVILWGIPSRFGADPTCLVFQYKLTSSCWSANFNPQLRLFSTLGQPNWLASFLVQTLPIVAALSILVRTWRVPLVALAIAQGAALVWTGSRGGIAGAGVAALVFVALLARQWKGFGRTLLAVVALLTVGATTLLLKTHVTARPETITIRASVWEGGVAIWRAYPFFGSGVETFAYAFDRFRPLSHLTTVEWDFVYNKAHNEFVNTLATMGLVGLFAYLFLIATFGRVLWQLTRDSSPAVRLISIGVLSGMGGYLISIFFGFSVVPTYLLFLLLPILVYCLAHDSTPVPRHHHLPFMIRVAQGATCLIGVALIFSLIRTYLADLSYAEGKRAMQEGFYGQALVHLTDALAYADKEPTYLDDYAFTAAVVSSFYEGDDRRLLVQRSRSAIEQALHISPQNTSLWKTGEQVYTQLATLDKSFAPHATVSARTVVALAPNDIRAKYTLAVRLLQEGSPEAKAEAHMLLKDAVERKPDFAEGWYSLALLEFERGATPLAVRAMEHVLKQIPTHAQAQEYLTSWSTPSAR